MKMKYFTAYKININSNQDRWDYRKGLTKDDVYQLPLGSQTDADGKEYFWNILKEKSEDDN